jgi:hypothetical protein
MITQNQVALLLHPDTFYDGDENTLRWKDGHETTEAEQSTIDAEVTRLQAEYDNNQYQRDRAEAYPSIADQLDKIYHSGVAGWKADIKVIKDAHPKPE